MYVSGKFDSVADAGFYQTIQPDEARRQFNMSLGLVVILSLVALFVGLSAGFAPLPQSAPAAQQARLIVRQPQRVHVMQAQARSQAPGG